VDGILAQKWAFQKGLLFLVTIFALGFSSLLSVTTFEKKKRKLFEADADRRAENKKAERQKAEQKKAQQKKGAASTGAKPAETKATAKPPGKPGAKPAAKPAAKLAEKGKK